MAALFPFAALRPTPATVSRVAAVPYDVVNTDEARALAGDNPLSFLRVSRAEIELPAGHRPIYSDEVYQRAADNFDRLRAPAPLVVEDDAEPLRLPAADGRARADRRGGLLSRWTSTSATSSRSTRRRGPTRKTTARATS